MVFKLKFYLRCSFKFSPLSSLYYYSRTVFRGPWTEATWRLNIDLSWLRGICLFCSTINFHKYRSRILSPLIFVAATGSIFASINLFACSARSRSRAYVLFDLTFSSERVILFGGGSASPSSTSFGGSFESTCSNPVWGFRTALAGAWL